MSARRSIAAALAALAALAAPAGAVAAALVAIRELPAGNGQRAFLVAATGPDFDPNALKVVENGRAVSNLDVQAAREAIAVALVVDASPSMAGAPISAAVEAAGAILGDAPREVAIAVYLFNSSTRATVPFGASRSDGNLALAGATTATGTRLYDAVAAASHDLAAEAAASRLMILISDGVDNGSEATLAEAVTAARAASVHIFTIAVGRGAHGPAVLGQLATDTTGSAFTAPDSATMAALQGSLAAALTRTYTVRFDSFLTTPGAEATTVISAPGYASATVRYLVPLVAPGPPRPASAWSSAWAMWAVIALAGAVVFLIAVLVLRPRRETVAARVARYHMSAREHEDRESVFLDDLLSRLDRRLGRIGWAGRLALELDQADVKMRASDWVAAVTSGGAVVAIAAAVLLRQPAALVLGLLVPVIAWLVVRVRATRRLAQFTEQLPDNLAVLSQSLRAGFSLLQALDSVADNAAEPSRSEFRRLLGQTRLGGNVETAMDELGVRMASRDFGWVVAVVAIQTRVGGNMAEVLDAVSETVLERQRLRRQVKALTAQGRMTQIILSVLPVALGFLLYAFNPDLMGELLHRTAGLVLLAAAAGLTVAGSFLIHRIVRIEI